MGDTKISVGRTVQDKLKRNNLHSSGNSINIIDTTLFGMESKQRMSDLTCFPIIMLQLLHIAKDPNIGKHDTKDGRKALKPLISQLDSKRKERKKRKIQ